MTKKANRLILSILIFIIIFSSFPITTTASTVSLKKVRVGYYENEVFEDGASEGAVKSGYAYEYYRKLSEYTGWDYEYVYGDFVEIYQMLLDGDVDVVAGLAYSEKRAESILYPDSPMGSEKYSFVKHDTDDSITSDPKTFSGKKIGVLNSAIKDALDKYLKQHRITADIVSYNDYNSLLAAFDRKQIDVLAAENDGLYDRKHAEYLFSFGESDYYIGVCPGKPYLLKELNEAQEQLFSEEPSYISTLRNKYYPVTLSSRAYTDAEKKWLEEHSSIIVGYLNDYLPYSGTDKDGNVTGMVSEVVPTIFSELNISDKEIKYRAFDSYDKLVEAVNNGEVDTAFPVGGGLYYSEEDGLYLSNALISSLTDLIYRGDVLKNTVADFAINENNKMQYYYVKAHFPNATIAFYPSIEDCLKAVVKGEVSYTTLNGIRTSTILKKNDYRSLSFRQLSFSDDRCFGVKIGNDGLLKLLNRGVNILGPEYLQNISYKYMDNLNTYTLKDLVEEHFYAVFFFLCLVVIGFYLLCIRDIKRTQKRIKDKEIEKMNVEKISSDKTAFLNNLTHNLRYSLNAIVGLIDLTKHSQSKEDTIIYIDKITFLTDILSNTVSDVLDLSRLESGQVKLEEKPVNIYAVINDVRSVISAGISEKNHIKNVNYRNIKHPNILTDKLRLSQILINVLTNAVKYTPDGSIIVFNIEEIVSNNPEEARFLFQVKDNGPGMSSDVINSIFDPYAKERMNFDTPHSIGYGLAICKKILDMMNGSINVFTIEGKGTEVLIEVPFKINNDKKATEENQENDLDSYNFYGKRVLVVEDNLPNQVFASKIMKKVGFEIQVAVDVEEAFIKILAAPNNYFDLVLMNRDVYNKGNNELKNKLDVYADPLRTDIPVIPFTNDTPALMKNISELLNT